jgi:hypothetical protein
VAFRALPLLATMDDYDAQARELLARCVHPGRSLPAFIHCRE